MHPVATWRLSLLRAVYLLLAVGGFTLGADPGPAQHWALMHGVVISLLGSRSLALLGLRYPLQRLPLLF